MGAKEYPKLKKIRFDANGQIGSAHHAHLLDMGLLFEQPPFFWPVVKAQASGHATICHATFTTFELAPLIGHLKQKEHIHATSTRQPFKTYFIRLSQYKLPFTA